MAGHEALADPVQPHFAFQQGTAAIDKTITRPGTVRINVEGAFIVDDGTATPETSDGDEAPNPTRDIRLPHHTAVVSHVAVDVRQAHNSPLCGE